MQHLEAINYANLSETVYRTLCESLIKGRFKPGERLRIRELAAELGTSVTPVRDAILRLSHDEAVIFRSPRHIQVQVLSPERYLEIRNIRFHLEGLAAATAAEKIDQEAIDELNDIIRHHESAMAQGDGIASAEFNQAFHLSLAEIAQLPVLKHTLRRLWLQMGPLLGEIYSKADRLIIKHHYSVVEALKKRDPEAAAKAIQDDIMGPTLMMIKHIEDRARLDAADTER